MNANDTDGAVDAHRRVFVTWSHTSDRARHTPDPVRSAQANAEWRQLVFNFVAALRESGIDADVDLAHLSDIDEDWTRYGPRAVAAADVVLIITNQAWQEAWNEDGDGGRGRGAAAEADVIRSLYNRGRSSFQGSFVLVSLSDTDEVVPLGLDRVQRVRVRAFDSDGMSELLRLLTGQPEFRLPPVGPAVIMPAVMPTRSAPSSAIPPTGVDQPHVGAAATGEGDAIVDLETPLRTTGVLLRADGNQHARHFCVRPVGSQALVNTTKPYTGTTFVPLDADTTGIRLEIKATGTWSLRTAPISDAPDLRHGDTATGSDDTVLRYTGAGGVARITGNADGHFFCVRPISDNETAGRSIVSTTEAYAGSVLCPPGPLSLVVRAVGPWTVHVS